MELGIRDWMIIVGLLLVLVVLLDGYRRVRNERRGNIRMSLNKQFLNSAVAGDDSYSELPSGGGRVINKRGSAANHSDNTPVFGDGENDFDSDGYGFDEPEYKQYDRDDRGLDTGNLGQDHLNQDSVDLDQSVPMLMEPVIDDDSDDDDPLFNNPSQAYERNNTAGLVNKPSVKAQAHPEPDQQATERPSSDGDTEVIVINVVAKNKPFNGPDLLHILLACDLRFGEMNIFHRYERANGGGAMQFSVANSVEPGFFDLNKIDDFTTRGVCFFMSVPGPKESLQAFEYMVETAKCVATNLGGDLLDDSRSAMTSQTLEHCRQRLREFERRQLTH
ncbi:MAG: cell division protein ZipA [Spongiibacteraceae bacterium]